MNNNIVTDEQISWYKKIASVPLIIASLLFPWYRNLVPSFQQNYADVHIPLLIDIGIFCSNVVIVHLLRDRVMLLIKLLRKSKNKHVRVDRTLFMPRTLSNLIFFLITWTFLAQNQILSLFLWFLSVFFWFSVWTFICLYLVNCSNFKDVRKSFLKVEEEEDEEEDRMWIMFVTVWQNN